MTGHQSNDSHNLTSTWYPVPKEMERPERWSLDDADFARHTEIVAAASRFDDEKDRKKWLGWPNRRRDKKSQNSTEGTQNE